MLSVVYTSTAQPELSELDLSALLWTSRRNNTLAHLTGLLLHQSGHFLQVLEGPTEQVRRQIDTIRGDSRHSGMSIFLEETTTTRQFPDWTMRFATLPDSSTKRLPGFRSSLVDLAAAGPSEGTQVAIQQLIGWFQTSSTSS